MPECLDNMPWRSLKGLGDMAPDFLRLGDFKNVRLKDDTLVQFRIIGFKLDVAKSGRILPLTWEMVDCLPNRHRWNSNDTNRGSWGATELFHKMNDEDGVIYQLMPDEILEVVEPVIKLTANTYDGANCSKRSASFGLSPKKKPLDGTSIRHRAKVIGTNITGKKMSLGARSVMVPLSTLCCVLLVTTTAAPSALCPRPATRTIATQGFPMASPRLSVSNLCIKSISTTEVVQDKTITTGAVASVVLCPQWLQPPRGVGG